jgi:hypothetical protein
MAEPGDRSIKKGCFSATPLSCAKTRTICTIKPTSQPFETELTYNRPQKIFIAFVKILDRQKLL